MSRRSHQTIAPEGNSGGYVEFESGLSEVLKVFTCDFYGFSVDKSGCSTNYIGTMMFFDFILALFYDLSTVWGD
jgi:hypothetical protein